MDVAAQAVHARVCVCAPLDMSALTSACFQDPAFLVKRQYVELA